MQLSSLILPATVLLLAAVCAGCGRTVWPADATFVTRVFVEPPRPTAGSEALLFIEYADTHNYAGGVSAHGFGLQEVSVTAGTLSEVTDQEFLSLQMDHPGVGWIYRWQTPDAAQLVVIQASLPDGGKSIKVEVLPAE